MTTSPTPREFWGIRPDHPLDDDGQPLDQVIGDFHILFTTIHHPTGKTVPDYQIHDGYHACYAHLHSYNDARVLCAVLSATSRGYMNGMQMDWDRAGLTEHVWPL